MLDKSARWNCRWASLIGSHKCWSYGCVRELHGTSAHATGRLATTELCTNRKSAFTEHAGQLASSKLSTLKRKSFDWNGGQLPMVTLQTSLIFGICLFMDQKVGWEELRQFGIQCQRRLHSVQWTVCSEKENFIHSGRHYEHGSSRKLEPRGGKRSWRSLGEIKAIYKLKGSLSRRLLLPEEDSVKLNKKKVLMVGTF